MAALLAGFGAGRAEAGASLVIDASTGAILHQDNATTAWHPASTAKMMTAYLALRAVREGRIGLETPIPVSKLAAAQPRVKVYAKPGQEITLDAALKIMMVRSANDIAYVVAEGVGGSVENFVAMMNAEARRLGLGDTVFRNPNGWHHAEQQTSARDLAVLAMTILQEFPEYRSYWNIGALLLGRQMLQNTNGLVGRYAGISGFKTGYVCASGFNLVATASRGGRTLIAVVLGAYSGAERTIKAAQLLDAGFNSWSGSGDVRALRPSNTYARNICLEVRARGRGMPLADDSDVVGPITYQMPTTGDGADIYAGLGISQPAVSASVVSRSSDGRMSIGPRASFVPIQVSFGRSAGSASAPVAANAGGARAVVARTQPEQQQPAVAAAPAAAAPAGNAFTPGFAQPVTGAAAFAPATAPAPAAVGGPIRLHGAIGSAEPAPLRPSSAAGIRPPLPPARAASAPQQQPAPARPAPAAQRRAAAAAVAEPVPESVARQLRARQQAASGAAAPTRQARP